MTVDEIRAAFRRARWELRTEILFGAPGEDPLIGDGPDEATKNRSICAWPSVWNVPDPNFDLYDADRNVTVWTHLIPTPEQAAKLLAEHGVTGTSSTVGPEGCTVNIV
jgi:hypothetical protein